MSRPHPDKRLTFRNFAALFGLGLTGVLALLLTIYVDPAYADQAAQLGVPLELLAVATGVQSLVLLGVSVLVGLYAAPRLGFHSHLLERVSAGTPLRSNLRPELGPALAGGLAVGGVLVVAQRIAPATTDAAPVMTVDLLVRSIPLRLFYGGITEELLLRWGVMSLVAFAVWKVAGRGTDEPSPAIVWSAIVVAAVLFGVLHLPAAAPVYGTLTAEVVLFIVGLNAIGGIVFGWLFWRQSLEAAMAAHATAHVVALSVWSLLLAL